MRRLALLATTLSLPGLLGGCVGSGYYSYLGNTFTLPGANPNIVHGNSQNYLNVRKGTLATAAARHPDKAEIAKQEPAPMLFQAGDVWPGPPKPPPSLRDLQKHQNLDTANGGSYAPLAPLPQLPGFEVPEQTPRRPSPPVSFPGGVVQLPNGAGNITGGAPGGVQSLNGPTGNGSIVVPNGNGTSTVIGPNGTVTTIKTPGK